MKPATILSVAVATLLCCGCLQPPETAHPKPMQAVSPNGNVEVSFSLSASGEPSYSVTYRGEPILQASKLGLILSDGPALDKGFRIVGIERSMHNTTWKPVTGERSKIRDHYEQLVVMLEDGQNPPRQVDLTFRAYNSGAAVSYTVPEQPGLKQLNIKDEVTEFRFTADHPCWVTYDAQGEYFRKPLSHIGSDCKRPLVVEVEDGPTVALGEARLVDYSRMRFKTADEAPHTVVPDLAGPVSAPLPFTTPWRYTMIADTPGQLIEQNDLVLNLNDPCAISDPSWIRPGKALRSKLTTEAGKACVDAAVKMNLQYVEFDAGWYGPENSNNSDATTVTLDPKRSQGPLDLLEVIQYARERDIGVLLYVNRRALERQLDELLPLFKEWGVAGIKFGFVRVGPQEWTQWLHEAVAKCAEYEMVVDIHDYYRPTGWSRTYPNLLTQEGIWGNEQMPTPEQNLIQPFTRFLCGPADYTVCYYSSRIQTTRAHQLAAAVVYYSPLQFLFWYDQPTHFKWEPELDFWKELPTIWDETRVINGSIGDYITVVRRKGKDWFVGSMNAGERRQLEIPLTFLSERTDYTATIHSDESPKGDAPKKVRNETKTVTNADTLIADIAANGGHAVYLRPSE